MVAQVGGEWVTFLSLFAREVTNGFEGVGWLRRLVEGWKMVCEGFGRGVGLAGRSSIIILSGKGCTA